VAELGNRIDETIHEIRIVQAYGHEDADRQDFGRLVETASPPPASASPTGPAGGGVLVLVFGAIAFILWVGGTTCWRAPERRGAVGLRLLRGHRGRQRRRAVGGVGRSAAGRRRHRELMEILATAPAIQAPGPPPARARRGRDRLRWRALPLPARPDTPALDDFDLRCAPARRWPWSARPAPARAPSSSSCCASTTRRRPRRIDGVPSPADPLALRRRIALVSQEAVIFAASVADNVRYARPDASLDEVRAACAAAFADEFIAACPRATTPTWASAACACPAASASASPSPGRSSPTGRCCSSTKPPRPSTPRASAWSSGPRRPDAPAHHLVIAHRLATVQKADRIVVMDDGRIVQQGSHAELIALDGLYAHLAKLQFVA
jgi:ATP-binding cassette subfamily B protein